MGQRKKGLCGAHNGNFFDSSQWGWIHKLEPWQEVRDCCLEGSISVGKWEEFLIFWVFFWSGNGMNRPQGDSLWSSDGHWHSRAALELLFCPYVTPKIDILHYVTTSRLTWGNICLLKKQLVRGWQEQMCFLNFPCLKGEKKKKNPPTHLPLPKS